jgi:nucleoside-diphosphate-sugar epimerase
MTSDGTPWRPLVHGLDIARAIIAVLNAPTEAVHNEIFNVGDTSHNYRVREIAETWATFSLGARFRLVHPAKITAVIEYHLKKFASICRFFVRMERPAGC